MSELFESGPITPEMVEQHISKVRVYPVNDCEWWATFMDLEEFKGWYVNTSELPAIDVDVHAPLTDEQMNTMMLVEHEWGDQPITYRQGLAFMFDSGVDFSTPEPLATTEY